MFGRKATPGRVLLTVTSLFTAISPFLADFNKTHIYNEKWTPHAKFHTGQTMSMGAALGLLGLFHAWRRPELGRHDAGLATTFASLYWVTQATAILYPQTALVDPPTDPRTAKQPVIIAATLSLNGLAYALVRTSRRR